MDGSRLGPARGGEGGGGSGACRLPPGLSFLFCSFVLQEQCRTSGLSRLRRNFGYEGGVYIGKVYDFRPGSSISMAPDLMKGGRG